MLAFFTIHLLIQIYLTGNQGNCGCFGALIEMTPLEAIIKNVVAIILLFLLNVFLQMIKISFKNGVLYLFLHNPVFYLFFHFSYYIPIENSAEKIKYSEFGCEIPICRSG